jgi:hypothetical protein
MVAAQDSLPKSKIVWFQESGVTKPGFAALFRVTDPRCLVQAAKIGDNPGFFTICQFKEVLYVRSREASHQRGAAGIP